MSAVVVWFQVSARQGGARMVSCRCVHDMQVTPMQVWPALSSEVRTRIAGLLAQLAVNMVDARTASTCMGKEVVYVQPTRRAKNPSWPS
jgi:hypothetical protein